jgi:hypothetical protein
MLFSNIRRKGIAPHPSPIIDSGLALMHSEEVCTARLALTAAGMLLTSGK